jgi:hypothetical protein
VITDAHRARYQTEPLKLFIGALLGKRDNRLDALFFADDASATMKLQENVTTAVSNVTFWS